MKLLLESGANVNAAMQGGWTPMHYAVQAGDAKTARRLLEAGADLGMRNKLGKTPLEVGPPLELIPVGDDETAIESSSGSDAADIAK